MPLCGTANGCGCAVTSAPAGSGEIDGFYPSITVDGSGTPASPWIFNLDEDWASEVADALNASTFIDCDINTGNVINGTHATKPITSGLAVPASGAYTVTPGSGRITVLQAGNYDVQFWMSYTNTGPSTAGYMQVYIRKNGTPLIEVIGGAGGEYNSTAGRRVLTLAANDYLDFTAFSNAATVTTRTGVFGLRRIS